MEQDVTVSETEVEQTPAARREAERCPTCGAALPPGSRFCAQCGRALAAALAPVPGSRLTIAFVDLEGFTAFASQTEDEAVRDLIRTFHGLVREAVGRHGGYEVKQLGDGFMLAFSSPKRAVACAVDVQRRAERHAEASEGPSLLRISAGLNSGDAIREGDDFFGHTVNVASRIAERAKGGQVLVAETTRVLTGEIEGITFADVGRRRLRGLQGRQRVYEVVWWDE